MKRMHGALIVLGTCVPLAMGISIGDGSLARPAVVDRRSIEPGDVMRGRQLVIELGCGGCHGGGYNPANEGWLQGERAPIQAFTIGPFTTHPRNLTPDNATGIGRFSDRQIFNALRYGLRPGETPDVEITSSAPGQGNFPARPKYLAVPMPWPAYRHLPDQDLWDVAAYLKRGLKPIRNRVPDSEGPPDFWASEYTVEKEGPYPALPFPTANEIAVTVTR